VSRRQVIVYELNEVPWEIVDRFVAHRPASALAGLLADGCSMTTVVDDSVPLQPWRTWPTFHTSLNTVDHRSFDLGQDPTTFCGPTIWDVAEDAGLSVGVWGAMQSWPARQFKHGGFYMPDTFSSDAVTFPASLSRFQEFNLRATKENGFSSDAPVRPSDLLRVGLDLARLGLTPRSAATLAGQLVKERREPRYKGRRSIMQAPLSFDLYWHLQKKEKPDLSLFFTNHVAGMMHRFWGDAAPGYAEDQHYPADPVFGGFVGAAMELADRQLARVRRYVGSHPGTLLLVAASMGQGPIPYHPENDVFVVEQPHRLASTLGLPEVQANLAMYPHIALQLPDESDALPAAMALAGVRRSNGTPLFGDMRVLGSTVSFQVDNFGGAEEGERTMVVGAADGGGHDGGGTAAVAGRSLPIDQLGITVKPRLGGANTAYHIPQGMALAWGAGIRPDHSRREVDILDVTPSLLADVLDVPPHPGMQGRPGLFAL
jgi:hypothetical protein